jgi:hypothetical protein
VNTPYASGEFRQITVLCVHGWKVNLRALEVRFSAWPQWLFYLHPTTGEAKLRWPWTLTEATTGRVVAFGKTHERAVKAAQLKITRRYDRFAAAVERFRKGGGQ